MTAAPPRQAVQTEPTGLTEFLDAYAREYPAEVVHIQRPVRRRHELTAILARLERERKFPVVVFEHVTDDDGTRLDMPVVSLLMSSRLRLARALGTTVEQAGVRCFEGMQRRVEPVRVERHEAPVKQVVELGEAVDVTRLPAPVYHAMDPGPYVSAGFLTTYHPELGVPNSALHRGWLRAPREIGVYMVPSTHNAHIYRLYEREGRDMPAAYWIGHHPLAEMGCQAHVALEESHFATAGGVLGAPLRLVPSETLGEDFLVPADAEMVIEGYIPAGERHAEGPFGEYTRYVGPQRWNPVMRVTAITRRRQAVWDDLFVGHTHWLGALAKEGATFEHVKRAVPTLLNVHLPMSGGGAFHVYLQLRNTVKGLSKTALLAALTADFSIKHAFAFDEDVDIFDERQVLLALATRFQGDQDLVVVPGINGPTLDPSGPDSGGCKVGFDCTKPVGDANFAPRLEVPPDVLARVNLADWIGDEALARIPAEPWG
jgi:2,5-furandicarboxylate decarboxylase 1